MESDSSSPKTSRKISEPSDGEEVEHVSNPNAPGHFLGYVTDPERAFETHEDATEWVSIPIDDLVELCYSYLGTLHTTLWADWDISGNDRTKLTSSGKEQGRIVAARWLAEQIENVATLAQEAEDHD